MIRCKFLKENLFFFLILGLIPTMGFILGMAEGAVENNPDKVTAATEVKTGEPGDFEAVRAVLQSPRCQNCHIPGDAPLKGDRGDLHGLNVKRGEDGKGNPPLLCTVCHQSKNGNLPQTPPGALNWHLPPPSTPMVFINRPANALCEDLKNPSKNGNKTPEQLIKHISTDSLVLWGWDPGPGRTKPPISHEAFVTHFSRWVSAGMPCP